MSSQPQPVICNRSASGTFRVTQTTFTTNTQQAPDWVDLTDSLNEFLQTSGIAMGRLTVLSRHTTACIAIQENEPLLLVDIARKLREVAAPEEYYQHDDFSIRTENLTDSQEANGHSHCQALFIGQTVSIPVAESQLQLGRWQRVFLLDLDSPRQRQVLIRVEGLGATP